jgi:16S rRNA (adenine1518-N6/adenine1519-N6)-dimethyltransferase
LPRKLGQHFLVRDATLERLAVAACGDYTSCVIEIGAGRGALTRHLLPRTSELHAIEVDDRLAAHLRMKFAGEPKLRVQQADVLAIDLAQWGPAVITGNLPYYITSPIIEKFLKLDNRFRISVFLVQSEVAERLSASPGSRAYGFLTVATQLICHVEVVCHVPATAFTPRPKVDSTALRFERKAEVPINLPELLVFVSRCFAQKRKTLRNNLRPYYGPVVDVLPQAGLRAEQLTVGQFIRLHERLSK